MGDRCIIHFHDGETVGPAIYHHWIGGAEGVCELLGQTKKLMESRGADVAYVTARCIGLAHTMTPGNLSLGTWSAPSADFKLARAEILRPSYSHGDAGVLFIDCRDWTAECHGGYGPDDLHRLAIPEEPRTIKLR